MPPFILVLVALFVLSPLPAAASVAQAPPVAIAGAATLSRDRGVWVLRLKGTREEMAWQHGRLIADRVEDTALPYFSRKIHESIAQSYVARDFPFLTAPIQSVIDWLVLRPLRNRLDEEDRRVAVALARGAGIPERDALNALVLPDAGQWLTARLFHRNLIPGGAFGPIPGLGCSSAVATSALSESGLIHARNLDYEGYGIFDRHTAVIYFDTDEPGDLDSVSISSLGVHTAGITGANEAGITLSLHQTMVDQVSRTGGSILAATERVIRKARTLDEALSILGAADYSGSWKIILSSASEDRAIAVEVSSKGMAAGPSASPGEWLLATNHVLSPLMKKDEFSISYRYYEDTRLRLRNLTAMASARGPLTLNAAVDLISSPEYFAGLKAQPETRSSHGIVAKMNNVQSAVFVPAEGLVYVATPPEPSERGAAPKPLQGIYVPFELPGSAPRSLPPPLSRSRPYLEPMIRAHAFYRGAARLASEESRFEEALGLIVKASEEEPAEALYPIMAGITAMRLAGDQSGRANVERRAAILVQARRLLDRAASLSPDRYQRSLISLFLGRLDDLAGEREAALGHYAAVDRSLSRLLDDERRRHFAHPYRAGRLKKLVADYIHGDVFRF